MGTLTLLALVFAVLFGGIVVAAAVLMRFALQRLVVDRHQALEEILATGAVPAGWQAGRARGQVTRQDVRRLERLARYVERSSLVESEAARQEIAGRLAEVRSHWREVAT